MQEPLPTGQHRALLIYDGDCAFCQYSVDYARACTGEAVEYQPYQQVGANFPEISTAEFRASIQLLEPGGARSSGAAAAFRCLELGGHTAFWARLYRGFAPFAALCELLYRLVARHRVAAYRTSRVLFGRALRPARVDIVSWLFLRLLALVYLAAFGSFTWQAAGLVGDAGILPASAYFAAIDAAYGLEKYALLPSLLWFGASTTAIVALGLAGCLLSLLLLADRGSRAVLPLLYLLYLSLYYGGQIFTGYQWDALLLECGFLAIFLPWYPRLFSWLYRWLLFRFMLQSGIVKLASGDPQWRDLTALYYHFETQPLPDIFAWYAQQLPHSLLKAGVLYTFLVELPVPFLMLLPRKPRQLAAALVIPFQLAITLTGSYNFFNLLTLGICLLLLDDQCLRRWLPRLQPRVVAARWMRAPAMLAAALYLCLSTALSGLSVNWWKPEGVSRSLLAWSMPWQVASNYGLFAVMTTERREIVFEGSDDGVHWKPYELPYKPGDPARPPGWATPRQPRLDWQLWFAALGSRDDNRWVGGVMAGLLSGSEPVLRLFSHNPFPDAPPRFLRAAFYRYHFTTPDERAATGDWWRREYLGLYWPVTAWREPVERQSP